MAETDRVVGGRYRLVAELGSGGMGRVWQAYDEMLDVAVAVKEVQLPPVASAEERSERLARAQREARHAARLREHPNVVSVYDVLIEDERPWIVMRLIHGVSLAETLDRHGPLTVERATAVARALFSALSAAHAAGIAHRDVKPANVLLTDDGGVLLTDFGIAKHEDDTKMTASGMFVGSLNYIPPERARGKPDSPAGDLFSAGATLYHALTGTSPFLRAHPAATLSAVLSEQPPKPERGGPLTELIMALLAKEPNDRPTADEALTAVAVAVAAGAEQVAQMEQPFAAKPPSAQDEVPLVATVVPQDVFSVPTVTAAELPAPPLSAPPPPPPVAPRSSAVVPPVPPAFGPPMPQAFAPPAPPLYAARPVAPIMPFTMPALPTRRVRVLESKRYTPTAISFSWDGALLVAGSLEGAVQLWNPVSGVLLRTFSGHKGMVHAVAFHPDGHLIATGGDDMTIRLWNVRDLRSKKHFALRGHTKRVTALAFSPDGRLLVSAGPDRTVRLWDARTGVRRRILTEHDSAIQSVAFSADSAQLATGGAHGSLLIRDTETGEPRRRIQVKNADLSFLAYSPDGRLVIGKADTGSHSLMSLEAQRSNHAITGPVKGLSCARLSPDGRYFVTGTETGIIRLWDVRAQLMLVELTHAPNKRQHTMINDIAIGRGGQVFATAGTDQAVRLFA
ncbi:MAG TPA: serine/threonine-protein kinase [Actinocrinis sp.]